MIRRIRRLWRRLFPLPELTPEEMAAVQQDVYQQFRDCQQDLTTPLLAAIKKHKEDA